jgi:hypothetical protein
MNWFPKEIAMTTPIATPEAAETISQTKSRLQELLIKARDNEAILKRYLEFRRLIRRQTPTITVIHQHNY